MRSGALRRLMIALVGKETMDAGVIWKNNINDVHKGLQAEVP